jgi:hypothetical protein
MVRYTALTHPTDEVASVLAKKPGLSEKLSPNKLESAARNPVSPIVLHKSWGFEMFLTKES